MTYESPSRTSEPPLSPLSYKSSTAQTCQNSHMANKKLTLRSFLEQPNPVICNRYSWKGCVTQSTNGAWNEPFRILLWNDFDLVGDFREILDREFNHQDLPDFRVRFPFHLTEIHDEDSLDALLVRWNNAVVSTALAVAQRTDDSTKSSTDANVDEIFMARGGQGWMPYTTMTNRSLHPDWAGIQKSKTKEITVNNKQRTSYVNILPGDSKLSTKWTSKLYQADTTRAKYTNPFDQIFTYCVRANARFGYLISQEELVAVRVSWRLKAEVEKELHESGVEAPVHLSRHSQRLKKGVQRGEVSSPAAAEKRRADDYVRVLEYKPIGWELDGSQAPNELTVNLALWCLHMMAKENGSLGSSGGYSESKSPSASVASDKAKKKKGVGSFSGSSDIGLDRPSKRRKGNDGSFRSDISMASG